MKLLQNLIAITIKAPEEKKTTSGLFIPPDKWGERQDLAYVKTLHDGYKGKLKAEDLVLINPYAVIDTPDKDLKLIKEEDVLAIWQ